MALKAIDFKGSYPINGGQRYVGEHAFTGAETSATVALPFKTKIRGAWVTYKGTPAVADGPPSYSVANGVLTVNRVAGTTAGLEFSFAVEGY
jgi:hypothetical protein